MVAILFVVLFAVLIPALNAAVLFPVTMFYQNSTSSTSKNSPVYNFAWSCVDSAGSSFSNTIPVVYSAGVMCMNNGFNNPSSPCASQIVNVPTSQSSLFSCVFQLLQAALPNPYLLYTAQIGNNGIPIVSYSISAIIAPIAYNTATGFVPQIFVYSASSSGGNNIGNNIGALNLFFGDPIATSPLGQSPGPACMQMVYTLSGSPGVVSITNTIGSVCNVPTASPSRAPTSANPTRGPTQPSANPTPGPTQLSANPTPGPTTANPTFTTKPSANPTPGPTTLKPSVAPTLMPTLPVPTRAPNTPTQNPTLSVQPSTMDYSYAYVSPFDVGAGVGIAYTFVQIQTTVSGENQASSNNCKIFDGTTLSNQPAYLEPGQVFIFLLMCNNTVY